MNPVILVHGLKDTGKKMERLARHLQKEGREAHCVTLAPSWGQKGLDQLASQLSDTIGELLPERSRFDLIGFSMGGLISRYYLQRCGGLERVDRFVSISTPHRGSILAWLIPNPGCRQMRPGSAFLRDLERDEERLRAVQFSSIWTPLDLMILPAASSMMPQAASHRLFCLAHPLMVTEPRCLRLVADLLARPLDPEAVC